MNILLHSERRKVRYSYLFTGISICRDLLLLARFALFTEMSQMECTNQMGSYTKFNPSIGTDTETRVFVSRSIFTRLQSISCMAEYRHNSFEEIRLEDYRLGRNKGSTMISGNAILQAGESILNISTASTNMNSTNNTSSILQDVKFVPPCGTEIIIKDGRLTNAHIKYQSITCMVPYETKSFEELRLEYFHILGRKDGINGENSRISETFQSRCIPASSQNGGELINRQSENEDKHRFGDITPQPARLILRGRRVRTTVENVQRFVEDIEPTYGRLLGNGTALNSGSSLPPGLLQNAPPSHNTTPPIRHPQSFHRRNSFRREYMLNETVLNFRRTLPQEQLLNPFHISTPQNLNASLNSQRANEMFSGTARYISSTQLQENVFVTNFIYNGIPPDFSRVDHGCEMIPLAFRFGQQRAPSSQIHNSLDTNLCTGIRMINSGKPPTVARSRTDQSQNSSEADDTKLPLCLLCEDNEREIVFAPCGHLVTCRQCGIKVKATCPVCRKFITQKIKTYIS